MRSAYVDHPRMRHAISILVFSILLSCTKPIESEKDFIDKLLDVSTMTSNTDYAYDEYVQLTQLYDSLAHELPEDKDERLILAERLKSRGFEVIHSGRGNFPPNGVRIVILELRRGDCTCEVSKMYYATLDPDAWQMVEGINCKRGQ